MLRQPIALLVPSTTQLAGVVSALLQGQSLLQSGPEGCNSTALGPKGTSQTVGPGAAHHRL